MDRRSYHDVPYVCWWWWLNHSIHYPATLVEYECVCYNLVYIIHLCKSYSLLNTSFLAKWRHPVLMTCSECDDGSQCLCWLQYSFYANMTCFWLVTQHRSCLYTEYDSIQYKFNKWLHIPFWFALCLLWVSHWEQDPNLVVSVACSKPWPIYNDLCLPNTWFISEELKVYLFTSSASVGQQ